MSRQFQGWVIIAAVCFILPISAQQLNPGDGVRIQFYNIEDATSGDFFIQQTGAIQLPYIGSVQTANRTFYSVRDEIVEKFKSIYRDPELFVQPLYKIKILGEVESPGVYFVTGVERVSDLLAMAGGETDAANLKQLYFVKGEQKINIDADKILVEGSKLNDIGIDSGVQLYVPRKRWLTLRNASTIISGLALIVTIISLQRSN